MSSRIGPVKDPRNCAEERRSLCSVFVVLHGGLCFLTWSRLSQAGVVSVIVVAGIAERFAAALGTAISADQHSAVRTHCDNGFAAANGVSCSPVFEFDLAGWRHLAEMIAKSEEQEERESNVQLRQLVSLPRSPVGYSKLACPNSVREQSTGSATLKVQTRLSHCEDHANLGLTI